MLHFRFRFAAVLLAAAITGSFAAAQEKAESAPSIVPLAVMPFQERGREVAELGGKVTDLLMAQLLASPDLFVVERQEIRQLIEEQELGKAGLTDPQTAAQVGRLTGAKVLISGSVFQVGDKIYLVAKLVGTESSRVAGTSVKARSTDDLDTLVEQLSKQVQAELRQKGNELIPAAIPPKDRIAQLRKKLDGQKLPAVWIDVAERHVGQPVIDPAAATELGLMCRELGFTVIDPQQGSKSDAAILLTGSGFSQFATQHGNLVSVKARLELKAVERATGRLLAVDRQTTVVADAAELIAAKSALEEAASLVASRLLPAMLIKSKDQ